MAPLLLTFEAPPPCAPTQASEPPWPRILVLDDDDDIREIYVEALIQSGYQVDSAADGQAGWAALQARKYDLLITDHEMPGLTGLELVKKVHNSGMPLAIIMASGEMSPEELRLHPTFHVSAALAKPFSPTELIATVRQVLRECTQVGRPANCVPGA